MLTSQFLGVGAEGGTTIEAPEGAQRKPPEALERRFSVPALDLGSLAQLQVCGAPGVVLVGGLGRGRLAIQAGHSSGMDPPALIVVAGRRPNTLLTRHAAWSKGQRGSDAAATRRQQISRTVRTQGNLLCNREGFLPRRGRIAHSKQSHTLTRYNTLRTDTEQSGETDTGRLRDAVGRASRGCH